MGRIRSSETPQARGQVREFNDLRLMAKAANQAMVRLERLGIKSPAYDYAQAALAIMGQPTKGERGARFDERGKATYNEYEYMKRVIQKFLKATTRTQKGAREWVENVWQGGNKAYDLEAHGISKEDWLDFWKEMPANQKNRSFGSEVIVYLMRAYSMKNGKKKDEQKMDIKEVAQKIQESKSLKEAYKNLGLTRTQYNKSKRLGKLNDTKQSKNKKR